MKLGLSSNLTVDATINPDFGQVEVDPAVVNLTAFETFFPEKRAFFLEGAQIFGSFGQGGSNSFWGSTPPTRTSSIRGVSAVRRRSTSTTPISLISRPRRRSLVPSS